MRAADQPTDPATPVQRRLVLGIVALTGIGLILFGANQSKLFGVAYLVLLVVFFGLIPVLELIAQRGTPGRILSAFRNGWRALLARCPWLPRAVAASIGVSLCGYFGIRRTEFPPLISGVYALLGVLFIAYAVAPIPRTPALDPPTGRRRTIQLAGIMLCLLPVLALGLSVAVFASNAPFFDEYITTLDFAVNFAQMSWDERFAEFISPHFGHRIVFTRAVTLAQLELFGVLNFYWLILFNYSLLCAGAAIAYWSIPRSSRDPLFFAPFLFILFQPQYHQVTLWAFGSPHVSSLCFTAATFLFLARQSAWGFWLGLGCALVAAYTFATGLFAGLTGLAVLLDQRRYREAVYWLMPITLVEMRYFNDLDLGGERLQRMLASGVEPLEYDGRILYALEFLGSLVTLGVFSDFLGQSVRTLDEFESARFFARAAGAAFVALFAYVSLRRYWRQNPVVYGLLAILVLSAALAADQRAGTVNTAYLSRYALNSCLVAGLTYLALLQLHPAAFRRVLPVTLFGSMLFCAGSYLATLPFASFHQRDLQFGTLLAANGVYQHAMPVAPGLPLFRLHPLKLADERGIYSIPEHEFVARFEAGAFEPPAEWRFSESPEWEVSYIGENRASYMFFLGPADAVRVSPNVGIVFEDENGTSLAFRATPFEDFAGHSEWIDGIAPDGATHYAVVPKSKLRSGPLRVAIAAAIDGTATVHLTNHYVPTIRETSPAFSPSTTPEPFHLTSVCSDTAIDTDGGCWFDDAPVGFRVDLPDRFTVLLLAHKRNATAGDVELWRIDFPEEDTLRSLRLSLEQGWFVLGAAYDDGSYELARVQAGDDAPDWVAVAVDGRDVAILAASPNEFGALASVSAGESQLQSLPGASGTLHLGDGTNYQGIPTAHLLEVSIREGATNVADVVAGWPLFEISSN